MNVLWHGPGPIGICVFGFPALCNSLRNRVFGLTGRVTAARARRINRNFASVSRVVLDPRYRGAGIAAAFLRRACELTPWPWLELVSEMANLVPFCESAGFVRLGLTARKPKKLRSEGGRRSSERGRRRGYWGRSNWTDATFAQYLRRTRFSRPGYYLFDNRRPSR